MLRAPCCTRLPSPPQLPRIQLPNTPCAAHPPPLQAELAGLSGPRPLDLTVRPDTSVVVITGPNTGGKTAAMKALGLTTCMARAGLLVPAAEPARLPCFSSVLADIGDEQSLTASLSTFSGHLRRIQAARAEADGKALLLLDELGTGARCCWAQVRAAGARLAAAARRCRRVAGLAECGGAAGRAGRWRVQGAARAGGPAPGWRAAGCAPAIPHTPIYHTTRHHPSAGTDPVEGAALGVALLRRLVAGGVGAGALTIATTHHSVMTGLKFEDQRFENACVEFDEVRQAAAGRALLLGARGA
jgi:DNA mismatch repair protein MutS2